MKSGVNLKTLKNAGLNLSWLARKLGTSRQYLYYAMKHPARRQEIAPKLQRILNSHIKTCEKLLKDCDD